MISLARIGIAGIGLISGVLITSIGTSVSKELSKCFYPETLNGLIFIVMAVVLFIQPWPSLSDSLARYYFALTVFLLGF